MYKLYLYFIWFILFCFPLRSLSQNTDDTIQLIHDTFKNIEREDDGDNKFLKVVYPLLKSSESYKIKLALNHHLGLFHNKKGLTDSAIYYGKKIIDLVQSKTDTVSINSLLNSYHILASANFKKGLIDNSRGWHIKGIQLGKENNRDTLMYKHTHGLATTYYKYEKYEEALDLYKECIQSGLTNELVYGSYINMANIYGMQKKLDLSADHYKKAIEMCEEEGNNRCIGISLLNLAKIFQKKEDYDTSILYYDKSRKVANKYDYKYLNLNISFQVGSLYQERKQYDAAYNIYENALVVAKELNLFKNQLDLYTNLKKVSIAKEDYKSAYSFEFKRSNLSDSIYKLQKTKEINELEIKYLTLQKEKEIELLKKEQLLRSSELIKEKNLKTTLLISFAIILIPSIALLFMYYQKLTIQNQLNKQQKEINQQKITTLIKDQELLLIEASVEGQDAEKERISQELHDSIGGNLAAIKLQFGSIDNGNEIYKAITRQIDETYNQVRTISHDLVPKKFNKNSFISVIKEYMKNIGGASKLNIICNAFPENKINNIDEQIQVEIFKILQELITNTIKHAKASMVEIQLNLLDNTINVLFEDNGIGFDANKVSEGIGFTNIKTRLHKLDGVINIDSFRQRGSIINLEIPITHIYNEV